MQDRRTYLRTLAASGIAATTGFASSAAATSRSSKTGSPGGSYFGLADGFTDPAPWLEEEDVQIYKVTEPTRDALEAAVTASGPRVVVFETSGTIDLGVEDLAITNDKCFVAGQTAPSPGITLIRGGFYVEANDCVVQHIRSRPGDAAQPPGEGWEPDAIHTADGTENNVIDHCTATWSVDEVLSTGYRTENNTTSNCLIAEPLNNATHHKGAHGYGSLIGNDAKNVALYGNLWSQGTHRNPRLKEGTTSVVVNNVMNHFDEAVNLDPSSKSSVVRNSFLRVDAGDTNIEGGQVYHEGNITDPDTPMVNDAVVELDSPPVWPDGLDPLPARAAQEHVLRYAGARPADRTPTDERVIRDVREGAGDYIDSQDDVGGYPDLAVNTRELHPPKRGLRHWLAAMARRVEECGAR